MTDEFDKNKKSCCSCAAIMFSIFSLCIIISSCEKNNPPEELIQNVVQQELKHHPQATLVDLYKFFFQDSFGPGHIIQNRDSAWRYLKNELQTSVEFDSVQWQPLGYRNQFYRINLKLVKNKIIPVEDYFDAFVQSANSAKPPSIQEWKNEWGLILGIIEQMSLGLPNFEDDKATLNKMLDNGNIVAHHSDIYLQYYHPHYRIVSRKHFLKFKESFLRK